MKIQINLNFFLGALWFLINLQCSSSQQLNQHQDLRINSYTISVNEEDLRKINIKASLFINIDTLFMDWEGASFIENGWSNFVNNLSISNNSNKGFQIRYLTAGRWLIENFEKPEQLQINYTVNLSHDAINWEEGGHDESSYILSNSIFFVGNSVFITNSKSEEKSYEILFDLPFEWVASSSLLGNEVNKKFEAQGETELTKSLFFIGDIITSKLEMAGLNVELVAAHDNQASIDILAQICTPLASSVKSYFGGGGSSRFYCVINIAPNSANVRPYFSGGAFPNAISLIIPGQPDNTLTPIIAYFFTHEFVHLWNGIAIKASFPEKENWFIEGFTDYITLKTLKNLGFIDTEFFLNGMQGVVDQFGKYKEQAGNISMRDAGDRKNEYYDLIYSGGFITAFITDIDVIQSSNGERSLKDFMQTLHHTFGGEKEESYSLEDLLVLMEKVEPDSSFEEIIENYVLQNDLIPLSDYLRVVGLVLRNNKIIRDSEMGVKEERLLEKLME